MSLAGGVWKAARTKPDFSPFEFSQRFTGTFTGDGKRIDGTWEIANDHKTWKKDFDLDLHARPLVDGAGGLVGTVAGMRRWTHAASWPGPPFGCLRRQLQWRR